MIKPNNKLRIGIYGGTFNPVHYGHIKSALNYFKTCGMEKLYVVPAAIPPHKIIAANVSPAARIEMLNLAFEDYKAGGIEISDFEIRSDKENYTIYTIKYFEAMYENKAELILCCGGDMFATLDSWFMADEIFQRATIAYSDRIGSGAPDIEKRYRDDFGARIILCDLPYIELSSSELREKARNGVLTSEYTPQKVVDYIVNHSLYK